MAKAGWYKDPLGDGLRFFDGNTWTERTRPQVEAISPPSASSSDDLFDLFAGLDHESPDDTPVAPVIRRPVQQSIPTFPRNTTAPTTVSATQPGSSGSGKTTTGRSFRETYKGDALGPSSAAGVEVLDSKHNELAPFPSFVLSVRIQLFRFRYIILSLLLLCIVSFGIIFMPREGTVQAPKPQASSPSIVPSQSQLEAASTPKNIPSKWVAWVDEKKSASLAHPSEWKATPLDLGEVRGVIWKLDSSSTVSVTLLNAQLELDPLKRGILLKGSQASVSELLRSTPDIKPGADISQETNAGPAVVYTWTTKATSGESLNVKAYLWRSADAWVLVTASGDAAQKTLPSLIDTLNLAR